MPWFEPVKEGKLIDDIEHYYIPHYYCDYTENAVSLLKERRAELSRDREALLGYKKQCENNKDREYAKFFGCEEKELLKQFRGYNAAIGIIEGQEGLSDWRYENVSKHISKYVDMAFDYITWGAMAGGADIAKTMGEASKNFSQAQPAMQ